MSYARVCGHASGRERGCLPPQPPSAAIASRRLSLSVPGCPIMLGDLGTKRYRDIVCIMYFDGRVKLSKKVLDDGNNPPLIIRYIEI
jgi:hypothetical protein